VTGALLPLDDALQRALGACRPIARVERLPLAEADGLVLAADVTAAADVPPFDRAAMDGYAVVAADTAGATTDAPRTLACRARIYGGDEPGVPALARGACIAISTGAPLPPGADAVVMVEHTSRDGDRVRVHAPVSPGQHVGHRARDVAAGARVLGAGTPLTPAAVGALAATGIAHVDVFARPAVAILSTGSELAPPGQPLRPGQIFDINRFTLAALVERHGGAPRAEAPVVDSIDAIARALDAHRGRDLIVFSGGSSVGERDLVLEVLRARGEVLFHGLAVKPGKPTGFGRIAGALWIALPGNPASCLMMATLLVVPVLRTLARLPTWRPRVVRARLSRPIAVAGDRRQFYTVRLQDGAAEPVFKGSGEITSLAYADGYVDIPIGTRRLDEGAEIDVRLFSDTPGGLLAPGG
jgi:molybdenum cofactor synthesis domain-containing protein